MPAATIVEEVEVSPAPDPPLRPATMPASSLTERNLPAQRVVLTGFMGAGKSTIGKLLAEQIGWRFIDVDREIEAKAGMTVAEIFVKLGEFVFRRMETSAIAHALGERRVLIALGGGAPEVLANRLLLEQTPGTAVILLEAPLETLLERCSLQTGEGAERPKLAEPAVAAERFQYRAPLYRRVARRVVPTAGQTPQQTTEAVLTAAGLVG